MLFAHVEASAKILRQMPMQWRKMECYGNFESCFFAIKIHFEVERLLFLENCSENIHCHATAITCAKV